jgi:hypothetical protein
MTRPLHEEESSKGGTWTLSSSTWRAPLISSASKKSIVRATWGIPGDIPPFEVNALTCLSGDFKKRIQSNAFDQA